MCECVDIEKWMVFVFCFVFVFNQMNNDGTYYGQYNESSFLDKHAHILFTHKSEMMNESHVEWTHSICKVRECA